MHSMPRKRPNCLYSGKISEDSENVQVSGLLVRCQLRSRERCKHYNKNCLVKRRESTGVMCDRNIPTYLKEKAYKTAINRPWCMELNVWQLE